MTLSWCAWPAAGREPALRRKTSEFYGRGWKGYSRPFRYARRNEHPPPDRLRARQPPRKRRRASITRSGSPRWRGVRTGRAAGPGLAARPFLLGLPCHARQCRPTGRNRNHGPGRGLKRRRGHGPAGARIHDGLNLLKNLLQPSTALCRWTGDYLTITAPEGTIADRTRPVSAS